MEEEIRALIRQSNEAYAINRKKAAAQRKAREREWDVAKAARIVKEAYKHAEWAKGLLAEEIENRDAFEAKAKQLRLDANAMPSVDCEPLHNQITQSETVNAKVRENRDRGLLANEHKQLIVESDRRTKELDGLAAVKQAALESAKWPIDGLGFGEDGITFGGLPFNQASSAGELRVAVAIGLALNPTLRVLLIRDGSLLDDDNLRMLAEMVADADAQLWLERVKENDESAVVIEDGTIKQSEEKS